MYVVQIIHTISHNYMYTVYMTLSVYNTSAVHITHMYRMYTHTYLYCGCAKRDEKREREDKGKRKEKKKAKETERDEENNNHPQEGPAVTSSDHK